MLARLRASGVRIQASHGAVTLMTAYLIAGSRIWPARECTLAGVQTKLFAVFRVARHIGALSEYAILRAVGGVLAGTSHGLAAATKLLRDVGVRMQLVTMSVSTRLKRRCLQPIVSKSLQQPATTLVALLLRARRVCDHFMDGWWRSVDLSDNTLMTGQRRAAEEQPAFALVADLFAYA